MSLSTNYPAIRPSLLLDFANTGSLDPRITFTRSTTGVYYDGVTTAKAEENLLAWSQEFSNGWVPLDVTVTANTTTAPDGTSTADAALETAATNRHRFRQAIAAAGTYTVSVFAKPNGRDYLCIAVDDGNTQYVVFNLATGAVGASGGGPTNATITASTNGFYRCSVTLSGLTTSGPYLHIRDADSSPTSYAGDITKGLYLWGAQVEQRSSVTAYTATTNLPITTYIPVLQTAAANVARFDHNPVTGEALGLLVEEQRTNLLTYSEDFSNAAWVKYNSSISANSAIAPDGTQTADAFIEGTLTSDNALFTQSVSKAASAITYTLSALVKTNGRNFRLYADGNTSSNQARADFDLSTGALIGSATVSGTFTAPSASIVSVGNGWNKCSLTFTSDTATTMRIRMFLLSGTAATYTGNGYSGVFIWGAQLEAGAFPTSYIATTTAATTRTPDAASMTGTNFSSWYNQGEGTLYAEYNHASTTTNNPAALSINANAVTNEIVIYGEGNVGEKFFVRTANAIQATITASSKFATGVFGKLAGAYKTNDFSASANGNAVVTDASGLVPVVSQMNIGNEFNGSLPLNGTIKKIAYYPQRLTNAQLQGLTS